MSAIRVGRFSASPRARRLRRPLTRRCTTAAPRMYRYAPINAAERHKSRCGWRRHKSCDSAVKEEYCHTAGGLHGSGYFKLLDDAAFFAAQSLNPTHFVVTTSFTSYITKVVGRQRCRR